MIKDNIRRLQEHITAVCQRLGRDPQDITLVGVTKYAETPHIKEAVEAGLTHLGENKVQQALRKFPILDGLEQKVTKHFIGHVQTNKVKQVLQIFDLIQSVDSLRLAREIEKQAQRLNKVADILIQVNTSGEEQKYGVKPSAAFTLIEQISELPHMRTLGLMTIAPFTRDQEAVHQSFRKLRILRDKIKIDFAGNERIDMQYLSMGMTDDYEIALEEGADMVRIGRAIFCE